MMRLALPLAVLALAQGCSRERAGSDDPDAAFEQWMLGAPTVRIGGADALGGAELSNVRQVVPIAGDSILVTDSRIIGILLIDGRGTVVRQIGRQGAGPGEFRFVPTIGVLGDTIWTMQRGRVQLLDHDGILHVARPVVSHTIRTSPNSTTSASPRAVMRGGLMAGHLPIVPAPPGQPIPPPHGLVGILAYFDTLGMARDTLAWIIRGSGLLYMAIGTSVYFPGPHHFETPPLWAAAADGSAVVAVDRPIASDSVAPRYRVTRWDARGEQDLMVDVPYTPVAVPPGVVDSLVEVYAADMTEVTPLSGARTYARDSLNAPAHFPSVTEVFVGSDGRIWLAREGLIPPPFTARRYDVLDQRGRPAGTLTLPRPGRIMAATEDAVWVVELDADDVPTLLEYPIVRP